MNLNWKALAAYTMFLWWPIALVISFFGVGWVLNYTHSKALAVVGTITILSIALTSTTFRLMRWSRLVIARHKRKSR